MNAVSGIVLDLQAKTTQRNKTDLAPLPYLWSIYWIYWDFYILLETRLFTSVPSTVFDGPTIKALLSLYDNYVIDCNVTEETNEKEKIEEDAFLEAILATNVMQQAHNFLITKGYHCLKVQY